MDREALERLVRLGDGLGDEGAFGAFCREMRRRGEGEPDEVLTRLAMGEPSEGAWANMVERVDVLAEDGGEDRAYGAAVAANALMGHWPDVLRQAPVAWLLEAISNWGKPLAQAAPGWGLVRVIASTCWDALDGLWDGYVPASYETLERYGVERLFEQGALAPLTSLGLDAFCVPYAHDALEIYGDESQLRWACALRDLSLWHAGDFDAPAFAAMLEVLAFGPLYKRPLQSLSLRGAVATADEVVDWIEGAGWNKTLEVLSLEALAFDDVSFARLMSLPWPRLVRLSVPRNALGDVSAVALARVGWTAHLKTLDLSENAVGDVGALALLARPDWSAPSVLDLGGPVLGAAMVERLSRDPRSAPIYCYQFLQSRGEAKHYDPAKENYLSVPLWTDAGKDLLHRNWDIYNDAFHRRYEDHDEYTSDDSAYNTYSDIVDLDSPAFSRHPRRCKQRIASKGFFARLKPLVDAHIATARAWAAPYKSILIPFLAFSFDELVYRIDQWLETLTCGPFYLRRDRTYTRWSHLMDPVRPWTPPLAFPKEQKHTPRYVRYDRFGMLFGLAYCLEQRLIDPAQVWALLCAPEPPKLPALPTPARVSRDDCRHDDWARSCLSQPAIRDAHLLSQFRAMTQRALVTLHINQATDHPLWIALQQIAPDLHERVKGWKVCGRSGNSPAT